jgi:TldD protein
MRRFLQLAIASSLLLLAGPAPASPQDSDAAPDADPVLAAMISELERSKGLRLASLEDTYFIEYSMDDVRSLTINSSLGAVVAKSGNRMRVPQVNIRVGSPDFDNTNYVFSDALAGRGRGIQRAPLDGNINALRAHLWLATDRAYKGALAAISRKRAATQNVNQTEPLPDFSAAEPVKLMLPPNYHDLSEQEWTDRVNRLSAIFSRYPRITRSSVSFNGLQATTYLVNNEGTVIRRPENLFYINIRGQAQAADGMPLRNAVSLPRLSVDALPSELDLRRAVEDTAADLDALLDAPVGESYVGPVLFEGKAAAQLFSQLLGGNLALQRRPVAEPGRPVPIRASELEARFNARVLPEWMNVVDDPTQTEWLGEQLTGSYPVDIEGVKPEPVSIVEEGMLKNYLFTRQPVKGFTSSNGRARLPGNFGSNRAAMSNLFVQATETVSEDGLKRRMIEMCEAQGKPYGILIRKLDYPSSASVDEYRQMASEAQQQGGGGHLVSQPLLAYRIYPDGREELVRGLEFRGLNVRSLREILAASDESHTFHFILNNLPLALMGVGGYVTSCSVVSPSILIEDLELAPSERELQRLPVVPPPDLIAAE